VEDAERIGIRELRQHASRYVAMAKAGLRVPVTDRGKLVAYLVPADESGSVYARLVAAGRVRPAVGNLLDLLPPPPAEPGEPPASEVLQRMRDEEDY
jgi:prevent-host-death family protein